MKVKDYILPVQKHEKGFTIIELMIATIIFSIIILGGTAAIVQIGRMYYKGVISSQTQQTGRSVVDQISRPIQFAGATPKVAYPSPVNKGGIQTNAICIGNVRFTYGINAEVTPGQTGYTAQHKAAHALWKDTYPSTSSCDAIDLTTITNATSGEELLPQNMRLGRFSISNPSGDLWSIDALFIYGEDDLLLPDANNPTGCFGQGNGSQWCATSNLSTEVYKRIETVN